MTDTLIQIPVKDLIPREDNLRTDDDKVADDDMVASVRSVGIIQPLRVVRNGAGYYIDAGHRRLDAAQKAGLKTVPCVVVDGDPADESAYTSTMLIENLHRKDLTPIKEAEGYQRLLGSLKQAEIARAIGKPQSHVSRRLALLTLPPDTQARVGSPDLPIALAEQLAKLVKLDPVVGGVACTETWPAFRIESTIAKLEQGKAEAAAKKKAGAHGLPVVEEAQVQELVDPEAKKLQVYDVVKMVQEYTNDDGEIVEYEFEESYDPSDGLGLAAAAARREVKAFVVSYAEDDRPDGRGQKLSVLPLVTRDPLPHEVPQDRRAEVASPSTTPNPTADFDAKRKKAQKAHEARMRKVIESSLKASDVAIELIQAELRDPSQAFARQVCALKDWPAGDDPIMAFVEGVSKLTAAEQARMALAGRLSRGFSAYADKYDEAIAPALARI